VKFLIDMPLSPNMAKWLADQGYDAIHVAEIGLHDATDAVIMARAKVEFRTIITADLDYPDLLAASHATAPSLILFRNGNWREADIITRMREVLAALTEHDITRSIVVVERNRIRRRRLPMDS
jgi:predicted nuclease of predicted toxin-antitoxin system